MRKFHCSLFVLKRSYICYYMLSMTVPLNVKINGTDKRASNNAIINLRSRQLANCNYGTITNWKTFFYD